MTYTKELINGRLVTVSLDSAGRLIVAPPAPPPAGGGLDYPPGLGPAVGLVQGMPDGSEVVRPLASLNNPQGYADDAMLINDSLERCGRTRLVPGAVYTLFTSISYTLGQYFSGPGMGLNTVSLQLAAAAGAIPAVILNAAAGSSNDEMAGLRDLSIDIRSAAPGATGVQAGNIQQCQIENVLVRGSQSGGSNGLHALNQNFHTEQAKVRMRLAGCTNPVVFDVGSGTDPSFDRGEFDFFINQFNSNGNGVQFTNGALMQGGRLKIHGNFAGQAATNTGIVLAMGANSVLANIHLDVSVENDSAAGNLAPQTINFASGSSIDAYGVMEFLAGSAGSFQPSNNNGEMGFVGEIRGDTSLQTEVLARDYTQITTGFPAGWSGTVKLEKTPFQDQVFLNVNLAVAATTTVTTGETILAAGTLAAPLAPVAASQFVSAAQEVAGVWTSAVLQITTGGAVLYQGPGFTASGTSAIRGTVSYSNSQ